MLIIKQGAEAILYKTEFDGKKVLVKERIKKDYRIEQIDSKIRKERTRQEVKLLTEARKAGVLTPPILNVDEKNHKIVMEFIDGILLKEYLSSADKRDVERICLEIGRNIGKLHSHRIVHGDLTTSNMILKDKKIYFIDFGLGFFSSKVEDQGVDLNLLLEALTSTHFKILKTCWDNILKGYKEEYKDAKKVIEKIEEIRKRVRYVER